MSDQEKHSVDQKGKISNPFDRNEAVVEGRLVKAPTYKLGASNVGITNFVVASTTGREGYARTNFIPVRVLGKLAEMAADTLDKGSLVHVEGSINIDQWKDGEDYKSATYVLAERFYEPMFAKRTATRAEEKEVEETNSLS